MELRSRQLQSNFRGLFPTSPSSVRPNPSIVNQVIHNSPPVTTTGTQTPPTVTPRLSALRQISQRLSATTATAPITDTPVIPQRPNYTMSSNGGTRTVAASSNALSSNNNIDNGSSLAAQAQPHMPNVIRLTNYNQTQSAIQWWMLFCQWMNFYKMTEPQAIAAFPFYLDSIPQQWFFQLSEYVKRSLASLKEAFLQRFSVKKANFDVNLFHIQQKPDETIENYLARVYTLTNEYDVPNHLLVGITMQGLKTEIRKIVMPQKPENLEQLREAAMVAERTVTSTGSISESFAMSLNNLEERLMTNLTDRFEASIAAVSQNKFSRSQYQRNSNNPNFSKSFRFDQ